MTRATVAIAAVTYLVVVLQVTVGGRIRVLGITPDLTLPWVVALALVTGPRAGMVAGFVTGGMLGSLQQSLLGPLAISRGLAGLLSGMIATRLFREHWLVPVVAALFFSVVGSVTTMLLAQSDVGAGMAARATGIRALSSGALCPLFVWFLTTLQRRLLRREGEVA